MLTKEQILAQLYAEREERHPLAYSEETWHQAKLAMGALFIQAKELGKDAYYFVVDNYEYTKRGFAKDYVGYRRAYDRLKKALTPLFEKYNICTDDAERAKTADKINDKLNTYYVHSRFRVGILNLILKEFNSHFSVKEVETPVEEWLKQGGYRVEFRWVIGA